MRGWVFRNNNYTEMASEGNGLYVDGICVCEKPHPFIQFVFEKYYYENKVDSWQEKMRKELDDEMKRSERPMLIIAAIGGLLLLCGIVGLLLLIK